MTKQRSRVREAAGDDGMASQRAAALNAGADDFRAMFELASIGIAQVDVQSRRLIRVNDKYCEMLGYTAEELAKISFLDITHPDDRARDKGALQQLLADEIAVYDTEKRYLHKNGDTVWVKLTTTLLRDPQGRFDRSLAFVQDITARKHAEQAIKESEERFRNLADTAPVMIWMAGIDKGAVYFNRQWMEFTGRSLEQNMGDGWADSVHSEDVQACVGHYQTAFEAREPFSRDYRLRRHDGVYRWVNDSGIPRHDSAGEFCGYIGTIIDITERREADSRIRFLEQVSATLASSLDYEKTLTRLTEIAVPRLADWCAVDILDDDGKFSRLAIAHADPAKLEHARKLMERYPVNAAVDFGTYKIVHGVLQSGDPLLVSDVPDTLLASIAKDADHLEHLRDIGFKSFMCVPLMVRGRALGAVSFVFADSGRRYGQEDLAFAGEMARRAAIAIDNALLYRAAQHEIEQRRAAEETLRAREAQLQLITDITPVMFTHCSRDRRYVFVNSAYARMLGRTPEEIIGNPIAEIIGEAGYARILPYIDTVLKGEPVEYENEVPFKGIGSRWLRVTYVPDKDEHGAVRGWVASLTDITERKQFDQERARALQAERDARAEAELLRDIGTALVTERDIRELVQRVTDAATTAIGAELGGFIYNAVNEAGEQYAVYALSGAAPEVFKNFPLPRATPLLGPTLRGESVVRSDDVTQDPRYGKGGQPHGLPAGHVPVRSYLGVPVISRSGEVLGSMLFGHAAPGRFAERHERMIVGIAAQAAIAIDNARLFDAVRDQSARLQQTSDELEQRVNERTDELERANQSLRDEIVDRMGVEGALRDSESQYRMLFERNPLPAWVFDINTRQILAANETAVWQYGYTREDLLRMNIDDLHPPEQRTHHLDYAEQFPPETAYVGVWKHRKQDDTVIDVEMFVYEVLFQGHWARLVLASDITERKRTEQEFRLLETITRAISEAHDVDAALYAVLRHICETTGWALGEAWLPAPDGARMVCSRAWFCGAEGLEDFRHATWEHEVSPDQGLVGRAWSAKQPIWVPDVTTEEDFKRAPQARAAGLRAGIAFPVLAENEIVAVLAFFVRAPRVEDDRLLKLVSTIAAQVGLAIQRKRTEDRLRESEERFRLLVEGTHDYAIFMLDATGCVAQWNKGAERLKGYGVDEILGRNHATFYTPEDIQRELPKYTLSRATSEGVYEGEGWRVRKGGERFWAGVKLTALRDLDGTLRGFVKVTRDITERKEAEERLKESEARLMRAQEFSLLMVVHTDLDGRWLKVPPMLCATLDYTEQELLNGRFQGVTHPGDVDAESAQCERLVRGDAKSFDLEKRFLRRDGKAIWVYQDTSIVLDDEDRPLHFLSFIRNITQRKQAQEQLRKSEIQLSEAQRLAHLGSWEWDVTAGTVEWSDELYRIYGIPPGQPMSYADYLERVLPEDRERVHDTIAAALKARTPFTLEERVMRADGELRHLLSQGAIIVDETGESPRMVGVCLDITERKHAEQRLREYTHRLQGLSQRLLEAQETERRRIARELHDQIGQDLSVIKINLQGLKRMPGVSALTNPIDETIRIVESVLQTARNLSLELRPSMLDDLGLIAALRWYLDRQAQRAGFKVQFLPDTLSGRVAPTIETACFRLAQEAVTNILRHAGARHVQMSVGIEDGELEMRIVDDGAGFDVEAARARAASGESFGLLGMEERALLAGGRLEIISTAGKGTTIVARFPLNNESPNNESPA